MSLRTRWAIESGMEIEARGRKRSREEPADQPAAIGDPTNCLEGITKSQGNTKSRAYVFVLGEDIPEPEKGEGVLLLCFQREQGNLLQKVHTQGYVVLDRPMRAAQVAATLRLPWAVKNERRGGPGWQVSFLVARGPSLFNVAYCCSKQYCRSCSGCKQTSEVVPADIRDRLLVCQCGASESKGQIEGTTRFYGNLGDNLPIGDIVSQIQIGVPLRDLALQHPGMMSRHLRFAQWLTAEVSVPRSKLPFVVDIHGTSGSGKSQFASRTVAPDLTFWAWSTAWYDGLRADHQVMILDDIRPSQHIAPNFFLRVLDRYPLRLPIKGVSVNVDCPVVILTSALPPAAFWQQLGDIHRTTEGYRQFSRRLNNAIELPTDIADIPSQIYICQKKCHDAFLQRNLVTGEKYDPRRGPPSAVVPAIFGQLKVVDDDKTDSLNSCRPGFLKSDIPIMMV